MRHILLSLCFALAPLATAGADVTIINTTDEPMTYQIKLPNGDTKDGEIKAYDGYSPGQTTLITPDGKVTAFKLTSESGNSSVEAKAPYARVFLIGKKDGKLQFRPVSWFMDNGQTHKRQATLYNATEETQSFDLIDEKEMRKITLQPGEETTVDAKHCFGMGFFNLKFGDGTRLDSAVHAGRFNVLYLDKRSPGKVQAKDYGSLAMPRNTVLK